MFKNYFKITFRNYWKNRIYTLINVLGLSVGIACFIGIIAYTNNELSYDKHHDDAENIYRVKLIGEMSGTSFEAAVTGAPVGEMLYNELPEVTLCTKFIQYPRSVLFEYNEKKIYQQGLICADSCFFKMFKYHVIGDTEKALVEPYSLVMLESVARKYFGNENPIGKIIKWDNKTDYTVRAIIKEPLQNTHLDFEVLVSRPSLYSHPRYESLYNSLFGLTNFNYIKSTNTNVAEMNSKINAVFQKHAAEELTESGSNLTIDLQPITDIYLKSDIIHEIKQNGNITTVYIFIVVAILIVIISSINYINLSIANSSTRGLEVGLKKMFGARKKSLFIQFLGESVFLVIVSFAIGMLILKLITPLFDSISNEPFENILKNNIRWISILLFIPFIGLMAGSYPAFYLSSLKPISIIKGKTKTGKEKLFFRNLMIIFQFVISIFLLSSTWFIHNQINYINNKDLGFDKHNIIILSLRNSDMISKYPALKNELLSLSDISSVSASSSSIGSFGQRRGFYRDGYSRKDMMMILNLQCEDNYLDLMNIKILKGRNFIKDAPGDENKIIVNETLVNEFGINDPIGKIFRLPGAELESDDKKLEIIGVCKDFHYASLHNAVKPIIIWKDPSLYQFISVKIKEKSQSSVINSISDRWGEIYPDYPFEYFFLTDHYNTRYKADINMNRVFMIFTCIAIFIACLGVFGLTSYTTQKRTKEIGIRKVMGASISSIMKLISKDYVLPVTISAIVSVPASWYFINKWLQNFSYRINIQWFVFIIAPALAFIIALIAINIKAYVAARKNPVDAIRYE